LHKLVKSKERVAEVKADDISVLSSVPNQDLLDELSLYKKTAAEAEAAADYWRAQANGSMVKDILTRQVEPLATTRPEMEKLQQELDYKIEELSQIKKLMSRGQLEMQHEFASMWLSVQQLNKLDAVKDKALADMRMERDRVAQERHELSKKYRRLKQEFRGLQEEMQAIDEDLVRAVDAEGWAVDELLHSSRKLPIEVFL
jgi:chromosome segregation ATPase